MGSALRSIDIVNKCINILSVGIIVLHGYFHKHAFLGPLAVDHLLIQGSLSLVEIGDKLLDTALVVECFLFFFFPFIPEGDP